MSYEVGKYLMQQIAKPFGMAMAMAMAC